MREVVRKFWTPASVSDVLGSDRGSKKKKARTLAGPDCDCMII